MCCDLTASEASSGAAALLSDQEPRVQSDVKTGMADKTVRAPAPGAPPRTFRERRAEASLDARSRTRWCGLQRSRSPIPRTAWWRRPSKRRAAVGGDRAGRSCAHRDRSRPSGREPGRPAPPFAPGRCAAAGAADGACLVSLSIRIITIMEKYGPLMKNFCDMTTAKPTWPEATSPLAIKAVDCNGGLRAFNPDLPYVPFSW